jgi:N-acetylmuramoyl-L-alanine amidase
MKHLIARLLGLGLTWALASGLSGCASLDRTAGGVPIDSSHTAQGQDSRVLFLIIHYTVADFPMSLRILTRQEVSAHYLLSDESPPRIYRLVEIGRASCRERV